MLLLENKNAVVYGAGGSIGAAVAMAFAEHGANVCLVGRSLEPIERVAKQIADDGGRAWIEVADAFDEATVTENVARIQGEHGSLDVSINLIRCPMTQGVPLIDMSVDDVVAPADKALRANFTTARAAARVMTGQGSGVILALNSGSGNGSPMMGGTGPGDAALDVLVRNLAAEIGPTGVRVAGIWTAGLPETFSVAKLAEHNGGVEVDQETYEGIPAHLDQLRMTRKSPRLAEVAGTAAFLASDLAGAITGTWVNVTSGIFAS